MAMMSCSKENELQKSSFRHSTASSNGQNEPWFWFLGTDVSRDLPDFLGRTCSIKDELPWKIKACILYSARAHPGVLRSVAVFRMKPQFIVVELALDSKEAFRSGNYRE
ncbi:hypothetical protein HPP92_027461 [Vanilla planifolia]|uniref:Uncharacterized protein n=1 Tax=Vanilla planifolia TaxID=51239 RepID=A0A835U7M5_VANPL|nr:hypothetical protein HPP92_027461 [Vanilla planifolia]